MVLKVGQVSQGSLFKINGLRTLGTLSTDFGVESTRWDRGMVSVRACCVPMFRKKVLRSLRSFYYKTNYI